MKTQRHLFAILTAAVGLAMFSASTSPAMAQPVAGARYNVIDYRTTNLTWLVAPGATGYAVFVNGTRAPITSSSGAQIDVILGRLLGPADVVEVAAIDANGNVGQRTRAEYWSWGYVNYLPISLGFGQGSATLSADAVSAVRTFAAVVKKHGFTKVVATGHDAGAAPSPTGYRLGQARAKAARTALAKFVDVEITASSWGNAAPIASNATAAGRTANRRVDFSLR